MSDMAPEDPGMPPVPDGDPELDEVVESEGGIPAAPPVPEERGNR